MGAAYEYRCQSCGYGAEVSGGRDHGFVVETQTGYCPTCRELIDYPTRFYDAEQLPFPTAKCGICGRCGTEITRNWNNGDPCPRCGGALRRGPCTLDWD